MHNLLASSPTVEGIQRQVNAYWFSTEYRVDPKTLAITHTAGKTVSAGVRVVKTGKRYRFELV